MSLFSALSVSASGMAAQRTRAEVLVENLANSETTRTPEGGPYRRKDVVFETDAAQSAFASIYRTSLEPASQGVRVAGWSWTPARRTAAICLDIPTLTPPAMSRFRISIRLKTWSTCSAPPGDIRPMSRPSAR